MAVDIEVLVTKRETGQQWDIGEICEQLQFTLSFEGNAGSLDTSYVEDSNIEIVEGDSISVKINGTPFFYGWVFKINKSAYDSIKIKVYDIKRYLAYKDVDATGNETIDELFTRVCKMMNVEYEILSKNSYRLPKKIHDGETYNNMLQYGLDQVFIGTGERFGIRANGKKLSLYNVKDMQKDVILGDGSLLTDYQYSSDIENTYTAFKLQRDVASEKQTQQGKGDKKPELSETQKILKRKNFVYQDSENVKKWGVLQYYEKKDSKWTDAQMQQHLELVKVKYNRQTKTLKVEGLGHIDCIPGNMITTLISDLQSQKVAQGTKVLITEAKHTISHNDWTMSLDLEVL